MLKKDENVIMALWAWGWGGINFPDKMPRLTKCKIAGVSDNRPSSSPISRPVKSVMAKRSTYVDVTYYREFLTYRISTTSAMNLGRVRVAGILKRISYEIQVSYACK